MNKLIKSIEKKSNRTAKTKNGALSLHSSLNSCVDLFSKIGASRGSTGEDLIKMFSAALSEDPLKAMKILFYSRDIRQGQGERKVFREIINYLANNHSKFLKKNLELIPEFGRWDDLFVLKDSPLWVDVVELVNSQLLKDVESKTPSLLAKWMPSENASSQSSKLLAREFQSQFGISSKKYRKTLSQLREKIKVVERQMCAKQWGEINYEGVPSRAALIYRKAFSRNDQNRYTKYLEEVASGEKKINASALYPYDVCKLALNGCGDKSLDLQWNALPNYIKKPFNGLVVADVSGSMSGTSLPVQPLHIAISLAIYIAERNIGHFKDYFLTFSTTPSLQKIKGNTIFEKCLNLNRVDWGYSTDIQAVFDLVLDSAVKNEVPQSEMPEKLIIVSDMQFNECCANNDSTNFERIVQKYKMAGFEMPKLVFWNVNASYGNDSPVTFDERGVALVSGCSPSILKSLLGGKWLTPLDVMNETIETERYSVVKI